MPHAGGNASSPQRKLSTTRVLPPRRHKRSSARSCFPWHMPSVSTAVYCCHHGFPLCHGVAHDPGQSPSVAAGARLPGAPHKHVLDELRPRFGCENTSDYLVFWPRSPPSNCRGFDTAHKAWHCHYRRKRSPDRQAHHSERDRTAARQPDNWRPSAHPDRARLAHTHRRPSTTARRHQDTGAGYAPNDFRPAPASNWARTLPTGSEHRPNKAETPPRGVRVLPRQMSLEMGQKRALVIMLRY